MQNKKKKTREKDDSVQDIVYLIKQPLFPPTKFGGFVWKFLLLKSRNILAFHSYLKSIRTQF